MVGARRSCSRRGLVVEVVGARRSRSGHGGCGPWSARHGSLSGSTWLASALSWPTGWLEQLDVARLWLDVALRWLSVARSAAHPIGRCTESRSDEIDGRTWSELGGAARDVVDVVRGRLDMARLWLGMARSVARRGSLLHRCGPLDGLNSLMWLACGSVWLAKRLAPWLAQRLVRLPCCLTMARPTW